MQLTGTSRSLMRRVVLCASFAVSGCAFGMVPEDVQSFDASSTSDVLLRPDGPFVTADHSELPQIPYLGGRVPENLQIATVTFANDPHRADDEAIARYVVTSSWYGEVTRDYDMRPASLRGNVRLTMNAPARITDEEIGRFILAGVTDLTLPPLPDEPDDALYLLYFPRSTIVTYGSGARMSTSCEDFGAYHNELQLGQRKFAYAVMPTCPPYNNVHSELETIQFAASHEIVEAATDLFPRTDPAWRIDRLALTNPWSLAGGEVADLCESLGVHREGFYLTRSWSNLAAAAGGDPCVPSDGSPYYNVTAQPADTQRVRAGQSARFTITGWSTRAVPDWTVFTNADGTFNPGVTLSDTRLNNGLEITLTVDVPSNVAAGNYVVVRLYSQGPGDEPRVWVVAIIVQ